MSATALLPEGQPEGLVERPLTGSEGPHQSQSLNLESDDGEEDDEFDDDEDLEAIREMGVEDADWDLVRGGKLPLELVSLHENLMLNAHCLLHHRLHEALQSITPDPVGSRRFLQLLNASPCDEQLKEGSSRKGSQRTGPSGSRSLVLVEL